MTTVPQSQQLAMLGALGVVVAGVSYHFLSSAERKPVEVVSPVPAVVTPVAAPTVVAPTPVAPPAPPAPEAVYSPEGLALMGEYKSQLDQLRMINAQLQKQLEQTEALSVSNDTNASELESKLQNRTLALKQLCSYLQTDRDFPVSGHAPICREIWGY